MKVFGAAFVCRWCGASWVCPLVLKQRNIDIAASAVVDGVDLVFGDDGETVRFQEGVTILWHACAEVRRGVLDFKGVAEMGG